MRNIVEKLAPSLLPQFDDGLLGRREIVAALGHLLERATGLRTDPRYVEHAEPTRECWPPIYAQLADVRNRREVIAASTCEALEFALVDVRHRGTNKEAWERDRRLREQRIRVTFGAGEAPIYIDLVPR